MHNVLVIPIHEFSRIAHAVRGLKYHEQLTGSAAGLSHRSCGAWIEIALTVENQIMKPKSHRSCGAWIEICLF